MPKMIEKEGEEKQGGLNSPAKRRPVKTALNAVHSSRLFINTTAKLSISPKFTLETNHFERKSF